MGPVDLSKPVSYGNLKDRNVLITGGASGLGKSFVHMFAQHGANIVIADLNDAAGKQLEKELGGKTKVKFVRTDVSSFESQAAMLREALAFFPRNEVDIFVPSAGILNAPTQISPADPAELATLTAPPEDMKANVIKVNLQGTFVGTLLVARYGMGLHKTPNPTPTKSIVLICSLAGYCGAEGSVEYTTTKFGVRGLLRGLRKQLAGLGVRLNAVSPFYVETPMTEQAVPVLKQLGIPIASTDHCTEAVARLATDESAVGRSIFVMPEGLSDGGDDSVGMQSGKQFSTQALGEHWAVLINGPMSDEIPA